MSGTNDFGEANPRTMDLAEKKRADHLNAEHRRKGRLEYEKHMEIAAKADTQYRTTKAVKYVEYRHSGSETSEGAKIRAEADAAPAKERRELANGRARAALLKVDEAESERVALRDLFKTSERIDGVAP